MIVRILIPRPARGRRRGRSRRVTAAIMLLAAAGTLYALLGEGGLMAVMRMRARAAQLRYEVVKARHHNQAMVEDIEALRHDADAIEKLAREELHMAGPDETIYLLPPSPSKPAEEPATQIDEGAEPSPSPPIRR